MFFMEFKNEVFQMRSRADIEADSREEARVPEKDYKCVMENYDDLNERRNRLLENYEEAAIERELENRRNMQKWHEERFRRLQRNATPVHQSCGCGED